MTQFSNFETPPPISRERLKLEISNLARIRAALSSNEKKCKIRLKGVIWGSRDPLLEFWDPLISREWLKLETSNLAGEGRQPVLTKKFIIRSKGGHVRGHVTYFLNFWTP